MKREDTEPSEMTFFEHLDALRPHLVRGALAIVIVGLVAFFCKSLIIDTILFGPKDADFPTNRMLVWVGGEWAHIAAWLNDTLGTSFDADPAAFSIGGDRFSVINTSLSGQFNLHMKISLLTGLAMLSHSMTLASLQMLLQLLIQASWFSSCSTATSSSRATQPRV